MTIPWFDPGDGGANARVLFLLESPGPMSDAAKGSGIISVDNDDPTAENMWTFRRSAGLTGMEAVHWNAVPWYIPGGKLAEGDIKCGLGLLRSVLQLMADLEVVVPMGRVAQRAWASYTLDSPNELVVVPTWHPSHRGLLGQGKAGQVQAALHGVRRLLDFDQGTTPEPLQPRLAYVIRQAPRRAAKLASDLRKRGARRCGMGQTGSSR